MTMERMPTDKVSSPRSRGSEVSNAPTLFDDDIFLSARNVVEETPTDAPRANTSAEQLDFSKLEEKAPTGPIKIVSLSDEILQEKYERLERDADALADKRGISLSQALGQLDTEGIVAELNKREEEASRQAQRQAALEQANTNSIAIGEMRKGEIAKRRKEVARSYRDGSYEQKQALTEFDALEVVRAQRREQRS